MVVSKDFFWQNLQSEKSSTWILFLAITVPLDAWKQKCILSARNGHVFTYEHTIWWYESCSQKMNGRLEAVDTKGFISFRITFREPFGYETMMLSFCII